MFGLHCDWTAAPRMMVRSSAALWLAAALSLAACGDDGGTGEPSDDATTAAEVEVTELPDFTVSIEASTLSGNTPITIDFEAQAEGAALEDLQLRWIVDQVLAGEEPTLSFPFYRAGTSTVTLQADLRNEAGDVKSSETTVNVTLLGCADLQLDLVTLSFPTDVPPGAELTLSAGRLRNEGDRIEDTFEVGLALSADETFEPELDRLVPGFEVEGMPSGLTSDSSLDLVGRTFSLPADLVPGPYWVFVVADPGGVVNECQETNNHRATTNSIIVDPEAGRLPDLVLENLTIPEGLVVSQGSNLSYSFRLSNRGEADAQQFRYAFWISTDPVLDREDDLPIVLASEENSRVQSMPEGFELGFFKTWKVPEDLPDGDYWIIGEVDATNVIAESDESNNSGVTPFPFTMRFEEPVCYDMGLVDLEVSPLSTYWGGSVLLTATVENAGSLPTPDNWTLRIYLSLTQTLATDNAILVGTYPLEAIEARDTKSYEILVPISSDLPVIPHYVGVVIDPTGAFEECSESNNARLFDEPIKISALAEVDVSASDLVFHPDSVRAGDQIKVEYQLGNSGTTAATTFQVGVVLSADATIDRAGIAAGRDVVIDRLTVNALQPEEVREVVRDVRIPEGLDHAVPEWFVGVMADIDGFLTSDLDGGNNLRLAEDQLVVTGASGGCFEDELEDNDDLMQAVLVTADDGERLDDLGSCGDEDWYLVDVPAGVSLAADVTARPIVSVPETSPDLIVDILDPGGEIAGTATLGPSYAARAWAIPRADTYAVRIRGAEPNSRAAYDLRVSYLPPVTGIQLIPYEVLAAPASAYAGGRLSVSWYQVNIGTQAAGPHLVRVWASRDRELQPGLDTLLGDATVEGLGPQETISHETVVTLPATLQPGTWFVIVEVDGEGAVAEVDETDNLAIGGPLELDPLKVCNDDDLEPNDEAAIASVVAGDQTVTDAVVCPGLEDWYAVELALGDALEASIDYVHETDKGRLQLELWAPGGQGPLLSDARNGSGRVSVPYAFRAGSWLLRVRNDPGLSNQAPYTYDLDAEVGVGALGLACEAERYEPNDAQAGAAAIGCGTIEGTLCNSDLDYYVIPAVADQRVTVEATNSSNQVLVQIQLPESTSSVATIYGTGSRDYTPSASGPLYIKVSPRYATSSITSFDYRLTVSGIDGADLALRDLEMELDALDRGEDVGVGFAVVNQCTVDAPSYEITAWLSLDETVDAGDLPLLVLQEPGLEVDERVSFHHKVTIPLSTAPGLYYLIVEADSDDDVVEANEIDNSMWRLIEVNEPCVADRFEPNDTREAATGIDVGVTADLTACSFDHDWFALSTRAGQRVTIRALFSAADGDLDLRVYNPLVSETLPVATGNSTDDDEEVTVLTPVATTLLIRVSGYGGDSAPYTLVIGQ